ncbi:MAG: type II toxin-antitoxin system prevent-host-death family antitoxin [Zetaproteobacteria bacterium CG_4_10_14_3_um_filter_54_28]|nr:MAG: type II toxin-antitoxin system prevent-host-death family antitoxin [Zetaproteobacteria bacterium CG_4_10_14_3_um_filter_54_28]
MGQWQLQDAKARLSELIKSAQHDGPQRVTVRGKPTAVIISVEAFESMRKFRPSFVEMMRSSPLVGEEIVIERSDSLTRDISL